MRRATCILAAVAACLALPGVVQAAPSPGSAPAASMSTGRADFTATTFFGRVLVTGGLGNQGETLASAEIYDSASDNWSMADPMPVARSGQTATLLPDGRVLVAGGLGEDGQPLASAEIFDFTTGKWTEAAPMSTPRADHTATALLDGRVLVTGGQRDFTVPAGLASAEIYDPDADSWSPAPPMAKPRIDASATRLRDGRVLVGGGWEVHETLPGLPDHQSAWGDAQIFDPATNSWSVPYDGGEGRFGQTATLLQDGRVLFAGGGQLYFGVFMDDFAQVPQIFDPGTGEWSSAGDLGGVPPYTRDTQIKADDAFRMPGGRVLTVADGAALIYDPDHNAWFDAGRLVADREDAAATRLSGDRVLIAGGTPAGGGDPLKTTETRVPWSSLAAEPVHFGSQALGTTSAAMVALHNTGASPLLAPVLSVTGANAADFRLVPGACAAVAIQPGATCLVPVAFRPGAAGLRSASLHVVTTTTPGGAIDVPLTGAGVPATSGSQGPGGTPGPKGAQGPKGARGPRGRPGRDARVRCTIRKLAHTRRWRVACRIRYPKGTTRGLVRARLRRGGHTYAAGTARLHGRRVALRLTRVGHRRLRAGRYAFGVSLTRGGRRLGSTTARVRLAARH